MSIATRVFVGVLACSLSASAAPSEWPDNLGDLETAAVEHGIPKDHVREFIDQLAHSWTGRDVVIPGQSGIEYWQTRGVDIVPFLEFLVYESNLRKLDDPKHGAMLRTRAIPWLGQGHDRRTVGLLLKAAKYHMLNPRRRGYVTDRYDTLVNRFCSAIGATGHEVALEFLLRLQSNEFWASDDPLRTAIEENWEPAFKDDDLVRSFRVMAVHDISNAGNERALRILGPSKGIDVSFSVHHALVDLVDNWHGIPDADYWQKEGAHGPALERMREYCAWRDEAKPFGVDDHASKLLKCQLEHQHQCILAQRRRYCEYWARQEHSIVPFLVHLLNDSDLPPKPDEDHLVCQLDVLDWLALLGDEEGTAALLTYANKVVERPIRTWDERRYLRELIAILGNTRDDRALDILFGIQRETYWQPGSGPTPDLPMSPGSPFDSGREMALSNLRYDAARAIAFSGTERAVAALGTGQGIHPSVGPSLDEFFEVAVRTHVGVVGAPEWRDRDLSKDEAVQVRRVYEQYGKEFSPRKPRRKWSCARFFRGRGKGRWFSRAHRTTPGPL
ncbi:MAG: hypothetical protein GY851_11570 [bacterium]|nr:hypothetical protein [bacterium]